VQRSFSSWLPKLTWALLALALLLFARRCLQHGGFFAEDAYITFRFAENLARGDGLVWNPGGERVEGYTSPLHLVLLAAMIALGLPAGGVALMIGLLSVLGLALTYLWIVEREAGWIAPLAALVLGGYLVDARLAVHATAGLDTVMQMFLLALNLAVCLRAVDQPSLKTAVALALINLLCLLGRPDAAPYVAAQGLVLGIAALRDRTLIRWVALSYGVLLACGFLYLAFKQLYFGYLFPNPFYVKANEPGELHGVPSVIKFFLGMKWLVPLWVLACFSDRAALREWWRRPRSPLKVLLLCVPAAAFLLYFITVYPEVNYLSRFEYAAYFFFFVATGAVLAIGRPFAKLEPMMPVASVVVLLGLYKLLGIWFPWFEMVETAYYRPLGQALASTGLKTRAKLIFDSAGVVPYLSRFEHIDPVGLTDNTLSGRKPLDVWERETYLWSKKADVYVGPEPQASPGAADCGTDPIMKSAYGTEVLLSEARLKKAYFRIYGHLSDEEICASVHHRMRILRDDYTLVGEIPFPAPSPPSFTTFAYVRRDSPHHQTLVDALRPLTAGSPR
jgi:hypothetical protein